MTEARRTRVSRAAYLLGYAGLLPQAGAVALLAWSAVAPDGFGYKRALGSLLAFGYASLILSFLGGTWWGFAMRRAEGQARLVGLAVLPSLLPLALIPLGMSSWTWPLLALGLASVATLLVDRRLAANGEAPAGWMRLRLPLSLGLGGLTILAGLLAG